MKFKIDRLQDFFLVYISVWTISPFLSYGLVYRFFVVFAVFMWIVLELLANTGIFRRPTRVVILLIITLIYIVLMDFLSVDNFVFTKNLQVLIMFFFLLVYESRKNNLDSLSFVFWIYIYIFPVWTYVTLNALNTIGSDVARIIVRSSDEARELILQGVGGYGLVYTCLILFPVFLGMFFNLIKVLKRSRLNNSSRRSVYWHLLVLFINIILSVLLIIKAGYTIALSTLVVLIFVILMIRKFSLFKVVLIFFVLVLSWILFENFLPYIFDFLLALTDNPSYTNKINDIYVSLINDNASGTVYSRYFLYSKSLFLFLDNPLLGSIFYEEIGGHSFILDNYARWGFLWGSVLFYFILFIPVKYISINNEDFGINTSLLIAVFSVLFFNTAVASFGVVLYLIAPYFYYFSSSNRG